MAVEASPLRLFAAAAVLTLLACTPARPVVSEPSEAPATDAVAAARETLGEPLVRLAEAAVVLAADLDTVRHDLPRGQPMRRGFDAIEQDISVLRRAADVARVAARKAPHGEAGRLVADAADAADASARWARRALRNLRQIADLDAELLAATEVWDEAGSQSERRQRLVALADHLDGLGRRVAELDPLPAACTGLVDNRRAWLQTVRERTAKLAQHATSAGGERYDQLRDAYRRQPFGEDARTADARDRACFHERSEPFDVAVALRDAVERLQQLLG